ncbi:MAG TPA: TIM barrel protein, partial [Acidimicrobiales bacterium]|nr:TIM barrel protein [Acidimicrobiales bacterium]
FQALGMVSGGIDADAAALFDRAGLRCHELLGLQIGEDPAAAAAAAEGLAADAARIRASWVLVTFQVPLTTEVRGTVARCAATFEQAGAGFAVEFSPLGPIATIADALDVIEAAQPARAGMVIDSWNFCLGPSTWEDLGKVPLDTIAYVQFADALAPRGALDLEEAMRRRALPGEGVLDVERFVRTLRDRGWDGVVSMQVLSDELRRLPVDDYARRVHTAGARYWQ